MSDAKSPDGQESAAGGRCICGGNGPRLTQMAEMLLPSGEAGAHFRQAHLEMLKGIRALLDQRIDAMSRPAHGTRLDVE
jgi:hypothetical protein